MGDCNCGNAPVVKKGMESNDKAMCIVFVSMFICALVAGLLCFKDHKAKMAHIEEMGKLGYTYVYDGYVKSK